MVAQARSPELVLQAPPVVPPATRATARDVGVDGDSVFESKSPCADANDAVADIQVGNIAILNRVG